MQAIEFADAHGSLREVHRSLQVGVALPAMLTATRPNPEFFRGLPAALVALLALPIIPP